MIDVILTQRAEQDRNEISFYLRKKPSGWQHEEVKAALRIIREEQAKVALALDQLRRLPESGPVKAGAIRKITIPDSRYTMAYRITKNFKRVNCAQNSRSLLSERLGFPVKADTYSPKCAR
jgi:plasmid stabilization system protein ParE